MTTAEDALRAHVRAALRNAAISQAEACRRLGLSTKHLSQMLTGKATLALPWAEAVLGLCGVRLVIDTAPRADGDHPAICSQCATAADARLGPEHHCDATEGSGAACDCAHRTDRYRTDPLTTALRTALTAAASAPDTTTKD